MRTIRNLCLLVMLISLTIMIMSFSKSVPAWGLIPAGDVSMSVGFVKDKGVLAQPNDFVARTLTMASAHDVCPKYNCKFQVTDGRLWQNPFINNVRYFECVLKVITTQGNSKVSKLYSFSLPLTITQVTKTNGKSTEVLDGTLNLGNKLLQPDFTYNINNATFTIQGKKGTLAFVGNHPDGLNTISTAKSLPFQTNEAGSSWSQRTNDVAKKIVGDAASVLDDISAEISKGLGEK